MDQALHLLGPVAAETTDSLSWLGPVATVVGGVLIAAIGGVATIWRRRQDRQDQVADKVVDKLPSEKDGWQEVRAARAETSHYYKLYRIFEDLFYTVGTGLRALARTVHTAHPEQVFPQEVIDALAARPPDDLDKV